MQRTLSTVHWVRVIAASAALWSMAGCSRDTAPPATQEQPASTEVVVPVATSTPQAGAARPPETKIFVWVDADPDEGEPPLATELTADLMEEEIEGAQYSWDFGDGSPPSSEQNPKHTYAQPGEYTARVRVTDKYGNFGIDEVVVTVAAAEAPAAESGKQPEGTPEAPAAESGEQPNKDGAS